MHTYEHNGTVIHYNTDLSGDVEITQGTGRVVISGESLICFVVDCYFGRIKELEDEIRELKESARDSWCRREEAG